MSTKESVVIEQVIEKLKRLDQLSESLRSGKGLSEKKINKLLQATYELQEGLAVYKFIRSLPGDERLDIQLDEVQEEEKEVPSIVEEPITANEIIKQEVEEFEEAIAEDVEIIESEQEFDSLEEELPEAAVDIENELEPALDSKEGKQGEGKIEEEIINPVSSEEESETVQEKEPVTEREEIEEGDSVEDSNESMDDFSEKINLESEALGIADSNLEVNERAALQKDNSINTRLQKQPIADLRSAIGLNERFLYANELFNGNMEAFNLAINELNHIETVEDAFRIIDLQLKPKYNWEEGAEAVDQFTDLVERRFL